MRERRYEPASEALSTIGLFLNVFAVLAFAVGLAGLSIRTDASAAATVAVASVAFVASLACFTAGGYRLDERHADEVRSIIETR